MRRYLSLLLALLLLISGFPVTGTAVSAEPETYPTEGSTEPAQESMEPETEPTEPETEPTEPETEPTEESTEPETEPTEEPAEAATEPAAPAAETAEPVAATEASNPWLHFGQLHSHSSLSSGEDTPKALFQAARQSGMDFFAITDLGDSLAFDPSRWETGKAAAEAVTDTDFVGMYGYEMNWPERLQLGHISVFHTSGFHSWEDYGLQDYYESIAADPDAIGQWNHPGNQYGTFADFDHYSPENDRVMTLMEVDSTEEGLAYYTRALDKGWHVAPTGSTSGRTVILARELTETALYEAMAERRVYATEDEDLEITYTMQDEPMGTILKQRHMGETAKIIADFFDPTDNSIGLVEVVTGSGAVAAQSVLETNCDTLLFSLPAQGGYYYLRVTQPDGDIAVTAPVWIETQEELGIASLACRTAVPVQGEDTVLAIELYNREDTDFLVESVQIFSSDTLLSQDHTLTEIPAGSEFTHEVVFSCDGIGQTEITVLVSGTLEGASREFRMSLPLSFRLPQLLTQIVIDGSHGNAGLSELDTFRVMAADADIRVTIADAGLSWALLENCRFLLVTTPSQPFSEDFLNIAADYVRCGGSVLVCGQSAGLEGDCAELNRLLEAAGATLRLNRDTFTESFYNGGEEALLYLQDVDTDSPWCAGVTDAQVYRHANGCTVDPGQGNILVKSSTAAALAAEDTASGGTILAAGSLLPGNAELAEPANIWDAPYANRTIAENLLGIGGETLPLSTIRQAREADADTPVRIRGYVTAGTANVYNRFPDTLYLQDDTGGIAVMPFAEEGIAVGTPVEITGTTGTQNGNRILTPIAWKVLEADYYRYLPETGEWTSLLDPTIHGDELVEVEGECTQVTLTEGQVSGITLKDSNGNTAYVLVESCIFSGATGKNDLHTDIHKGDTVRAAGILHVDTSGKTVIRVRNCEEVVYIPPKTQQSEEYVNPKTGDWLAELL